MMTTKQYDAYSDLITFTRASTGTYLDSDGLLKTATTNTPRIEYDADGNRLGLLIEEARTNSHTNSGDMDGTGWTGFRATFSNGDTSPDGSQLFVNIEASSTDASGTWIRQDASLSATTYTMSVFAKAGLTDTGVLALRPSNLASFFDAVVAWFDLEAGTVLSASPASGSSDITTPVANIEDWGNGVYRCSLSFAVGSAASYQVRYGVVDADASIAVTSGKQVQVWGAQLEAGSFPTSYIPTSGATATRAADVASIPTSAFGYNQKVGSVVVGYQTFTSQGTTRIAELETDVSNRITLYQGATGEAAQLFANVANVSQADFVTGNTAISGINSVAATYAQNNFALTLNGGIVTTDTSALVPVVDNLRIGYSNAAGALNGHIKSIQYYPRRLTNAQLQELTA